MPDIWSTHAAYLGRSRDTYPTASALCILIKSFERFTLSDFFQSANDNLVHTIPMDGHYVQLK